MLLYHSEGLLFHFNFILPQVQKIEVKKRVKPNLGDTVSLRKLEKEILTLIYQGCKTSEIASKLDIGARTVVNY